MQEDPWIDAGCYVGSLAVAAARLQGSRHYFSQVLLGWWIGFLSTGAVEDAMGGCPGAAAAVLPYVTEDEVGFVVTHRF